METITNPEVFRGKMRKVFEGIIGEEKKSIHLEQAIFNYTIEESKKIVKKWDNPKFVLIYLDRLRTIYYNLKTNKNIQEMIKSNELSVKQFAYMTHQEMNPELWKELIEKKSIIDKSKYDTTLVANTDMFQCKKCKSKNCNYYTLQTRSADEPETIFISCLDCGKHWKS